MTRDEVLKKLKSREVKSPSRKMSWESWAHIAKITESIDYGCGFVNGVCKKARNYHITSEHPCCCSGCSGIIGYLVVIPAGKAEQIATLWNKQTGFWRKGTGCILPRELRSGICLGFYCREDERSPRDKVLSKIVNMFFGKKMSLELLIEKLKAAGIWKPKTGSY